MAGNVKFVLDPLSWRSEVSWFNFKWALVWADKVCVASFETLSLL